MGLIRIPTEQLNNILPFPAEAEPPRNALLRSLPADELARLFPLLERVPLVPRRVLQHAGLPIEHLFFIEEGLVSVLAKVDDRNAAEVGLIGRDGVVGGTVLLGGEISDLTHFVQIGGSPDRAAALLAGRVDAVTIGLDDWFELASQTDDVRLVQYMSEVVPDFATELYFSRREYIEENPNVALAIACGNLEANQWANENRDNFISYTLNRVPGLEEGPVAELYDAAMEVGMWPTDPEAVLSTSGLQGLMEAMLETGDIANPVEVAQYIDSSFLQQAVQMGCGQ